MGGSSGATVYWRGVRLDARTAAAMDAAAAMCPGIIIRPTQGSWSGAAASAGTHAGSSAIDLAAGALTAAQRAQLVRAMRCCGFAAWLRTPAQSDWPFHVHGILMADPPAAHGAAPAAQSQMRQYLNGTNGLANMAPDDGPRDFPGGPGILWEQHRPTDDEGTDDMPATFFQHKGHRYIAFTGAGVYRRLRNPKDEEDTRTVLKRTGVHVTEWSAGKDVDNPGAFGVEIGG